MHKWISLAYRFPLSLTWITDLSGFRDNPHMQSAYPTEIPYNSQSPWSVIGWIFATQIVILSSVFGTLGCSHWIFSVRWMYVLGSKLDLLLLTMQSSLQWQFHHNDPLRYPIYPITSQYHKGSFLESLFKVTISFAIFFDNFDRLFQFLI